MVKVMIDGGYQSFHRDEITEHRRPGYYTVRRGGKKYNVKYNQFEVDEEEVVTQVLALNPSLVLSPSLFLSCTADS